LLLRVDDIVSGLSKNRGPAPQQGGEQQEMMDQQ
jgi:T-complex protein 1 subunit gamma